MPAATQMPPCHDSKLPRVFFLGAAVNAPCQVSPIKNITYHLMKVAGETTLIFCRAGPI